MPKIRWTLDQKKHHVAAWRASGLTREQYCELYDIPFKSLQQWQQDVAKATRYAGGRRTVFYALPHGASNVPHTTARKIYGDDISGSHGGNASRPDHERKALLAPAGADTFSRKVIFSARYC